MNMADMVSETNECFSSAQIHENDGISGDPEVSPRVGADYQAEIPPLLEESGHWRFNKTDASSFFFKGLSVPLMWAPKESRNGMEETTNLRGGRMNKVVPLEASDYEKSSKIEDSDCLEDQFYPFPGSQLKLWNAIEQSSFLLGLYIFEKNLLLVKRFVCSKTMGEILSYYYGKFYGSTDYRRWSEGRNSKRRRYKSRRWIRGSKIFTGSRRKEVFSRLSCDASQDYENMLKEVSRMFDEGKVTLEEYVYTLKDTVGIDMLVDAVAIGQGKSDLTNIDTEPTKVQRSFPVHADIPVGKACSFLTSDEIIKMLTGNFRLSKARANDLFDEAVWPRLLARGWQSEQPRDGGSKNSVVYLAPGIEKYSRELVKGHEYFDSVCDILNKVASEPGLLELEAVQGKEEPERDSLDSPTEQDPEISSKCKHSSYLQPPNVDCNRYSMKFTVVDTSLASEGKYMKVRQLRSLPLDPLNKTTLFYSSDGKNLSADVVDSVTGTSLSADTASCGLNVVKEELPNDSVQLILPVEDKYDPTTNISSNRQSRMTKKVKFSMNEPITNISEQHSLSACSYREFSNGAGYIFGEESRTQSNLADTGVIELSENSSTSPFTGDEEGSGVKEYPNEASPQKSGPRIVIELFSGDDKGSSKKEYCSEASRGKSGPRIVIDLNIPFAPQDSGPEEEIVAYEMQNNSNMSAEKTSLLFDAKTQTDKPETSKAEASGQQQQAVTNGRRQSTRNRPTTKALEAIAHGFLDTRMKRKAADNSMRETPRRVRAKTTSQLILKNALGNVA